MNSPKLNYRYWKWVADPNNDGDPDECWGVFREVIWEVTLQQAWLGGWRDAYHFQFRAWEDPEFVEIDEAEANSLIAILLPKQQQRAALEAIEAAKVPMIVKESPDFHPLGTLHTAAIAMHELYVSFVAAGFTENQAMQVVIEVVKKPKEANSGT